MMVVQASMVYRPTAIVRGEEFISIELTSSAKQDLMAVRLVHGPIETSLEPGRLHVSGPSPYIDLIGDMTSMTCARLEIVSTWQPIISPDIPAGLRHYIDVCVKHHLNLNKFIVQPRRAWMHKEVV